MKKLLVIILAALFLCEAALAAEPSYVGNTAYYDLEPGIYEIGKDIPAGEYDLRYNGLEVICKVSHSYALTDSGELDMNHPYSYSIRFMSVPSWWNAVGSLITLFDGTYLEIEYSGVRLWLEEQY